MNAKKKTSLDKLVSICVSPISYLGWFLTSLFFTIICIPFTFLPEPTRYKNKCYFYLTKIWCKILMLFSFIKPKIEGKKNLQSSTPAIIVANHSSALDIFIIENLLGSHPHIWMTKHEYTKIPLFSILLKRMHIPVKRNDNIAAARAFLRAYHRAKNLNSHIVLFPEGTRHPDGKIHDFHPGFALLAKKLNRPVIPIAMTNLHKILPKNSLLINYHAKTPTISIGKPMYIETSESPSMNESFQEFATRVQTWIKNKTNNSNQAPSGLNPPVD